MIKRLLAARLRHPGALMAAALLAAGGSAQAQAQTQTQVQTQVQAQTAADLACVEDRARPELFTGIGDNIQHDYSGGGILGAWEDEFTQLMEGCASEIGLSDDLLADYFSYALNRISEIEVRRRLSGMGLDMDALDRGVGIGEGLTSPDGTELEDEHRAAIWELVSQMEMAESEQRQLAQLLGSYLAAASMREEFRAALGQ